MSTPLSLKSLTPGQMERAESLRNEGFSEADIERFARAEWREAQRISIDACIELQPLSKSERLQVANLIGDLVPGDLIIKLLQEKRAQHGERHSLFRATVNARRAARKAEKRGQAKADP